MRMHILHVSEVSWGGVVSLIREFAAEQNERGHIVGLLSPPIFPPVVDVDYRQWSLKRRRASTYAPAVMELRRAIEEFKPDVMHLHSFMAGFVGRLPVRAKSVPVVYQPHSWSFDLRDEDGFRRALSAWERFAGRRTDVLVTNCTDEIDEGQSAGVTTEGRVIGVAVDTSLFTQVDEATRQQYRDLLGVKAQHMVLCVGRVARQKGQDLLVAAWEKHHPADSELVLVGPGDTTELEALAPTEWGRTIRAVGEDRDVPRWMWACDLVVLPSRYEGTPVVVAEAMSVGRPVVATDVNGVRDIMTLGDLPAAGSIVALGDMRGLLAECERLLNDSGDTANMSTAGRVRAKTLFSPKAVVDRLDAAYVEAIGRGPVPAQRSSSRRSSARAF